MAHLIYLNSYEINLSDLSNSQICQRVRSVRPICEAVRVRSERPCGRPIGLSRTPGDAVILGAAWLISRLNALLRPVEVRLAWGSDSIARCAWEADRPPTRPLTSDSHGRSVRPWEAEHGLSLRTLRQITWLCGQRPWLDSHGLTDLRVRSASHAHRSDSGRSNAFSREISQASPRIVLPRPVEVRLARDWTASPAVRERPIGLPRPHRSERPCAWEAVLPWLAQTDHMTKVRGRERPCSSHWLQ